VNKKKGKDSGAQGGGKALYVRPQTRAHNTTPREIDICGRGYYARPDWPRYDLMIASLTSTMIFCVARMSWW
jgi:hypothetical protein